MLSRYGLPEAGTDLDFDAIYQQIYQRQVRWASQELQEAAGPIGWKVYCTVAQLNEMWAPRIGQEGI